MGAWWVGGQEGWCNHECGDALPLTSRAVANTWGYAGRQLLQAELADRASWVRVSEQVGTTDAMRGGTMGN
jgi:hypothetical protein